MKWITRARPKTDRIARPWLIHKFIDSEGEIVHDLSFREATPFWTKLGFINFVAFAARIGSE